MAKCRRIERQSEMTMDEVLTYLLEIRDGGFDMTQKVSLIIHLSDADFKLRKGKDYGKPG